MICGRVTSTQRDIIKRRCTINTDHYKAIINWLIDNHSSYCNMTRPECAPTPVVLGGFEETTNNTDESDKSDIATESKIDTEQITFAPRHEPSESTRPYQSEKRFIFSCLKGEKPTLSFRSGDYIGSHTIDLVKLFPLIFPYGWGGPDERRGNRVGKSSILRHYCRISLPQMQQSQFLLVLCSMWQRLESFNKCMIRIEKER